MTIAIARNFLRAQKPKRDPYEFVSNTVTWGELLSNDVAERDAEMRTLQLNPPDPVLENLAFLATEVIDPIREHFGRVQVLAGYRSPKLQDLVRAPRGSAITKGLGVELRVVMDCDIKRGAAESVLEEVTGKDLLVSPSWYLAMWLAKRIKDFPIESISVDGGDKGRPSWVTVSAHQNPERQRGIVYACGLWTAGQTVRLHSVDLRNLGVL